ncbi:SURF1 family protein [Pelagibacteraceae bacterium]|nr:SURF1 family protein [Pelagibacteraceae bacterium]
MIKNITFHSLFLIALVSLVYLGSWQLHRLKWKTELLNSIKDGQTEDYIEYPFDIKNNDFSYKKSSISGKIDQSKELHFFNINSYGQSGYNIIVPLLTKGRTVYIDLGWTNFTDINSKEFMFRSLNGELDFKGILIYSKERRLFSPKPDTIKNNWYLMNIKEMDQFTKLNSEKYIFRVVEQEYYLDLLNEFTAINIPNNHLQYAITWFALAISIAAMYIIYIYKNILKR